MNAKTERFKSIFPKRVEKIRDHLRILGNCSAKNNYQWDQAQVTRLFGALIRKFIETADKFGVTITAQVDGIEVRPFK